MGRRQAAVSWGRQLEVPPGLGHGVCAQWAWRAAVSGRKRSCPQAGAWTPSARGVSKGLRARVRPGDLRQVPSSEAGPGQRCRARGRDPGPGISRGPCSRGRGGWFVSGGAGPGQGAALCECAFPSQRALGWDVRVGTCTRVHTRSRLPRSLPWTGLGGAWSRVGCVPCAGTRGPTGGRRGRHEPTSQCTAATVRPSSSVWTEPGPSHDPGSSRIRASVFRCLESVCSRRCDRCFRPEAAGQRRAPRSAHPAPDRPGWTDGVQTSSPTLALPGTPWGAEL